MADLNKLRKRIHNTKLVLGMSAAGLLFNSSCRSDNESVLQDAKQDKIENVNLEGRIVYADVPYQVDTLNENNGTPTMAYFAPKRNTITQTYQPGNIVRNFYSGDDATLLHELKHQRDHARGVGTFSMSAVQYYKICAHREIAANIVSLLILREDYKKYGFSLSNTDSDLAFYDEAVKSGEINPKSTDSKDFMAEMAFIANSVRDKWIEKKLPGYETDFINMTSDFLKDAGLENANPDDDNYKKTVDICYNIGGLNFWDLMDKDIECQSSAVFDADRLIADGKCSMEDVRGILLPEKAYISPIAGDRLPEFDGSMSFEQYYQYMQHVIVAKESAEFAKKDDNGRDAESLVFNRKLRLAYGIHGKIVKNQIDDKLNHVLESSVLIPEKATEDKFNSKVREAYEQRGIVLENYFESNLFVDSIPETIREFENRSLGNRLGDYLINKAKRIMTVETVSETKKNVKEQVRVNYTGEPQYEQWSSQRRVSGAEVRRVIDLDKTVLAPEMVEADYYQYELSPGMVAEIEELRTSWQESLYNISIQKDGHEQVKIDSLVWIDKSEASGGAILAVTSGNEAVMLSEDGLIENISKKTGVKDVDACYWNNGVIMLNHVVSNTEENTLYAVVKQNDTYYKKILGHNVYDSDENEKIRIFNSEDTMLKAYKPEELKKEILNSETTKMQKSANSR